MTDYADLTDFFQPSDITPSDWNAYQDVQVSGDAKLSHILGQVTESNGLIHAISEAYVAPQDLPKVASVSKVRRAARVALIQASSPQDWKETLLGLFPAGSLKHASIVGELKKALSEYGLLGKYYIAAEDFNCPSKDAATFARKYASTAKYVLAKAECQGCNQREGGRCGVFQKKIVVDLPLTEEDAQEVEKRQASLGFAVRGEGQPSERIKYANTVLVPQKEAGYEGPTNLIPVANLLKTPRTLSEQRAAAEKTASQRVVSTLQKLLLSGLTGKDAVRQLQAAYSVEDLRATEAAWTPLAKQAGLYGHLFVTADSFEVCASGADFVRRKGSVRAVVAGSKCASCFSNQNGLCATYGRTLVASEDELYTPNMVVAVKDELTARGCKTASNLGGLSPRDALRKLYATAINTLISREAAKTGSTQAVVFSEPKKVSSLTVRNIVQATMEAMNDGLYGSALKAKLAESFEARDLKAATPKLATLLAEQGAMGHQYIDPRFYPDYGMGCFTAKKYKHSGVRYAKVGGKCASCVHQTLPGTCSLLNKELVSEVPYPTTKLAFQQSVVQPQKAVERKVGNGREDMQAFGLSAPEMVLATDSADSIDISFKGEAVPQRV